MIRIALLFAAVLFSCCNHAQKAPASSTAVPVTSAPRPAPRPVQTAPAPQAEPAVAKTAPPVVAPVKEPAKGASQEAKPVEVKTGQEKVEEKKPPTPVPGAARAAKEPVAAPTPKVKGFDLDMLTERLKQTSAIGVFTKLAINSDATDLIDAVKKYRKLTVLEAKRAEVRSRFDGLVMKLLALLEDDPQLARNIYLAREQIWASLLEVTP